MIRFFAMTPLIQVKHPSGQSGMSLNPLASALLLSLLTACSSVKMGSIGPHRIDVQQGNALDQESVAKLKPGLNRSQVRFLLGTPLLVDPFRNNRWDYVYTFHKGGKLAEQKRITLFFEGDILQRIEGDVPPADTPLAASSPAPVARLDGAPSAESIPLEPVKKPEPIEAQAPTKPATASAAPVASAAAPVTPSVSVAPIAPAMSATPKAVAPRASATTPATSVVAPLNSAKAAPVPTPPSSTPNLQLHPETNVALIKPDVIPPFPESNTSPSADTAEASVLTAIKSWSDAWASGNADAYLAAYAVDYAPPGGVTRADWEKRRRMLLGVANDVDLRIESPKVVMAADGHALVTFDQHYRSKNYNDALVKQLKLAKRDGRWLIVDEQVISTLQAPKP